MRSRERVTEVVLALCACVAFGLALALAGCGSSYARSNVVDDRSPAAACTEGAACAGAAGCATECDANTLLMTSCARCENGAFADCSQRKCSPPLASSPTVTDTGPIAGALGGEDQQPISICQ